MKKYLLLLALPMLFGLVGCKEEEPVITPSPYPTYVPDEKFEEAPVVVESYYDLGVMDIGEEDPIPSQVGWEDGFYYPGFVISMQFGEELDLTQPTYVWLESLDGKEMTFHSKYYVDNSGYALFSDSETVEIKYQNSNKKEYPYYYILWNVKVGVRAYNQTYYFVLKFYNPESGKYYVSAPYRLEMYDKFEFDEKCKYHEEEFVHIKYSILKE